VSTRGGVHAARPTRSRHRIEHPAPALAHVLVVQRLTVENRTKFVVAPCDRNQDIVGRWCRAGEGDNGRAQDSPPFSKGLRELPSNQRF
jgi:hypothetical protein